MYACMYVCVLDTTQLSIPLLRGASGDPGSSRLPKAAAESRGETGKERRRALLRGSVNPGRVQVWESYALETDERAVAYSKGHRPQKTNEPTIDRDTL